MPEVLIWLKKRCFDIFACLFLYLKSVVTLFHLNGKIEFYLNDQMFE